MCLLEPLPPITITPNALSAEADHQAGTTNDLFERLLLTSFGVSTMGNMHSTAGWASSPPPSPAVSSRSASASASSPSRIRQICSLSTFLLGGPMPPTPGLIPLCWEELLDWTDDATSLTELVDERNRAINILCGQSKQNGDMEQNIPTLKTGVRFIPYVSVLETHAALKKLASQTYMERAQFYQESVIVGVEDVEDGGLVCLISLFQFCRYYTLIRRLADSQAAVLEYPSKGVTTLAIEGEEEDDDPLISTEAQQSSVDGLLFPIESNPDDSINEEITLLTAPPVGPSSGLDECVICFDKTEDSVLTCCSHALCSDCERRWVQKRLRCPFCRQSFRSVKEAVQTQWQLSVAAIPMEQVLQDVRFLETKVQVFWRRIVAENDPDTIAAILAENYVQRPKSIQSSTAEGDEFGDEFVVIQEMALAGGWSQHITEEET